MALLLAFSTLIFGIGLIIVLTKPHALFVLVGIELMLSAAGFNFIAFSHSDVTPAQGQTFVLFIIAMAVCETAVALALLWKIYQYHGTVALNELQQKHSSLFAEDLPHQRSANATDAPSASTHETDYSLA
ncbi:MAG: NADH-quinone oxidoreductase subunit NuoK [Bacteroidota bacterium]